MNKIISDYLQDIFNQNTREEIIHNIFKKIRYLQTKANIDCIVVKGISGIAIGMIIAHKIKLPIVIIRKEKDDTHSKYKIEGIIKQNYIIIDDQAVSGNTIKSIIIKIKQYYSKKKNNPQCVGIFLYHSCYPIASDTIEELRIWRKKKYKDWKKKYFQIPIFRTYERLSKNFYI